MLEDEFREGNIPAGADAVSFLERCLAAMPSDKYIDYLQSDSAFYQPGVINFCFKHKMLFKTKW